MHLSNRNKQLIQIWQRAVDREDLAQLQKWYTGQLEEITRMERDLHTAKLIRQMISTEIWDRRDSARKLALNTMADEAGEGEIAHRGAEQAP